MLLDCGRKSEYPEKCRHKENMHTPLRKVHSLLVMLTTKLMRHNVSNIFVMLCFIYLLCDHFLVVEMTEHESLIKAACESQVLKELQSRYRPKLSFIRWG